MTLLSKTHFFLGSWECLDKARLSNKQSTISTKCNIFSFSFTVAYLDHIEQVHNEVSTSSPLNICSYQKPRHAPRHALNPAFVQVPLFVCFCGRYRPKDLVQLRSNLARWYFKMLYGITFPSRNLLLLNHLSDVEKSGATSSRFSSSMFYTGDGSINPIQL